MYTMKKQLYIFSLLIIIVFFSCGKSEATPDRDDPANDEFSIKDQIAKATFVKSIEYDTLINLHAGVRQVNLQLRTTSSQPIALYVVEVDLDRKSTRLNSSHVKTSYAVFCLKKKE